MYCVSELLMTRVGRHGPTGHLALKLHSAIGSDVNSNRNSTSSAASRKSARWVLGQTILRTRLSRDDGGPGIVVRTTRFRWV
jgi:hypothetical protein